MRGKVRGIVRGSVDEGRFAPAHERQAQDIHSRRCDDASVVSELTGSPALAGMFCAGELGPVGGRTFLHGFTASMALFRHRT